MSESEPQVPLTAQEWRNKAAKLAERIEAAGYRRGLAHSAPSDHEPEIAALLDHLAVRPQEQPKPNTETAHSMAPVGSTLPPSEDTRDAARYRFLRQWTGAGQSTIGSPVTFRLPPVPTQKGVDLMRGSVSQHLDAAIDAQIAAQAAQPKDAA